jgi:hypothetical protein
MEVLLALVTVIAPLALAWYLIGRGLDRRQPKSRKRR